MERLALIDLYDLIQYELRSLYNDVASKYSELIAFNKRFRILDPLWFTEENDKLMEISKLQLKIMKKFEKVIM